jgi:hypothetical protein
MLIGMGRRCERAMQVRRIMESPPNRVMRIGIESKDGGKRAGRYCAGSDFPTAMDGLAPKNPNEFAT